MITFRTSADIPEDRQVVVHLPPETPVGKADLVVTIASQESTSTSQGNLRRHFGNIHSGNSRSADNERIDADLAQSYANHHE